MLVLPGAQTAALGLTILVAGLPAAPRPMAIAATEPPASPAVTRGKSPIRIIAAASKETPSAVSPAVAVERPDVREVPAVQRINFEDLEVLGQTEGPDWVPVTGVLPAEQPSLIELRRHFIPEMVKALEDL